MTSLLLCLVIAAPPSASVFPEALTRPRPELLASASRWSWPRPEVFTNAYAARTKARRGYSLVRVRMSAVEDESQRPGSSATFPSADELAARLRDDRARVRGEGLFLERTSGGVVELVPVLDSDDWYLRRAWSVVRQSDGTIDAYAWGAVARLEVIQRLDGAELPDDAVAEWAYAATLLASSGPLYVTSNAAQDGAPLGPEVKALLPRLKKGAVSRDEVRALVAALPPSAALWEQVLAWARARKDTQLELDAYRHYQPVGRCSMDTRPREVAREYAELCYRRGDLGCFLQLQVRIMGDQFERVASSSYGEAANGTEVKRLESTGIDIHRFLLGLVFQLPADAEVRGGELGSSRLARAVIEAGLADAFRVELPRLAEDRELDAWNRVRATMTYVSLLFREGAQLDAVDVKLRALELHPVASAWWASVVAVEQARAAQR